VQPVTTGQQAPLSGVFPENQALIEAIKCLEATSAEEAVCYGLCDEEGEFEIIIGQKPSNPSALSRARDRL